MEAARANQNVYPIRFLLRPVILWLTSSPALKFHLLHPFSPSFGYSFEYFFRLPFHRFLWSSLRSALSLLLAKPVFPCIFLYVHMYAQTTALLCGYSSNFILLVFVLFSDELFKLCVERRMMCACVCVVWLRSHKLAMNLLFCSPVW